MAPDDPVAVPGVRRLETHRGVLEGAGGQESEYNNHGRWFVLCVYSIVLVCVVLNGVVVRVIIYMFACTHN